MPLLAWIKTVSFQKLFFILFIYFSELLFKSPQRYFQTGFSRL